MRRYADDADRQHALDLPRASLHATPIMPVHMGYYRVGHGYLVSGYAAAQQGTGGVLLGPDHLSI